MPATISPRDDFVQPAEQKKRETRGRSIRGD
jgi:hypothetical protein